MILIVFAIWHTDVRNSDSADVEMFKGIETGYVSISDEDVSEEIRLLFRRGYRVISKDKYIVVFQRWDNLDSGRGIVYSIDGSDPSNSEELPFLIEIKPLTEDSWYFYIEDFSEWRRRNSN